MITASLSIAQFYCTLCHKTDVILVTAQGGISFSLCVGYKLTVS